MPFGSARNGLPSKRRRPRGPEAGGLALLAQWGAPPQPAATCANLAGQPPIACGMVRWEKAALPECRAVGMHSAE
jgi:hypothetical protein